MSDRLTPGDAGYWTQRKEAPAEWPDADPSPEVTNRDPRPEDAPADPRSVTDLALRGRAAGWNVLVGYSRGFTRAQRVGEYKTVEVLGVWADAHPDTGYRWSAMYERTVGTKTWTWRRVTIWHPGGRALMGPGSSSYFADASVTDLKDFIEVRGSVPPSWFKGVHARVQEQEARQKVRARTRPTKTREAVN